MSKAVAPEDIHSAAANYQNTPFLLHASSGSVRANHVVADTDESSTVIAIRGFGRGLASRLSNDLALSLLWPAQEEGQLSLIADGTGVLSQDDADVLLFTVTGAVLHRPAPVDGPTQC